MSGFHEAFIGLGSNLNNPVEQINRAIIALDNLPQSKLTEYSKLYQTQALLPEDNPQPQPDYINAVAQLNTALSANDLFQALQTIERQQQRQRTYRWGPRTLDLDLLLYGQICIKTPELTVPHQSISQRIFVLQPLNDINPDLMIPGSGRVSDLLKLLQRPN